jgi:hypothetical protein
MLPNELFDWICKKGGRQRNILQMHTISCINAIFKIFGSEGRIFMSLYKLRYRLVLM